jgi:hypothetical protein
MKNIVLFTSFLLFIGKTSMSQMGYEYLLVATYEIAEPGKNWMCRDGALIQEKIADKVSFEKRRKEILQQYPGVFTTVRLIYPNQAIIVYEHQKKEIGWNCTKKVISVIVGKDLDICKNEMEKTMTNKPSPAKVVLQRTAINDNGYYVVSQNWDGIEVKYRFAKTGSPGEFAVIQIKNPLTDKAATIAALKKSGINQVNLGKPFYEITLEPGMSANFTLKTPDDYIIAMKFDKPGNTGEKERGVIDWIKGYIRSEVTKDYKALPQSAKDSINKASWMSGVRG